MSDNDQIKLFCTEWLLQNDCSRGSSCIFLHANMRDITLCDCLDVDEVFVKGSYNHGWQKNVKSRHGGRQRKKNFRRRQNANRDNNVNHRYGTRNNHNVNKQNEINTPSTSSNPVVTSSASSSSTGAYKKILNDEKKQPDTVTTNASESEDENSKNLPNLPHSISKDWIKSYEFTSKKARNSAMHNVKDNNQCNDFKADINSSLTKEEKKNSEAASATINSQEKVCGICFEVVLQKSMFERRFGILPNCNHCFCLACIRKWRQAKQFENNIIRACPECRITSDFVCPSTYWVETESDKEKLIKNYKEALSRKDCKYFKKGNGSCPFGNKCFYLHALNNGTKIDVGPPPSTRFENLSDEMDLIHKLVLLEYLHNDFLSYSDIEDDDDDDEDDDDDDDDLFEYMFWESDDDLCFY